MPAKHRKKLTLDQLVTYEIKVPGELDMSRFDWVGDITVHFIYEDDGYRISILTGSLNQATLQGLRRRLYSFGIPIISVTWIDQDRPKRLKDAHK